MKQAVARMRPRKGGMGKGQLPSSQISASSPWVSTSAPAGAAWKLRIAGRLSSSESQGSPATVSSRIQEIHSPLAI